MKKYKQILEAINRGIQLALDDFDDEESIIKNIKSKQVQNRDYTKEYLDLMKEVVDLGLPSGTLWCKYNLGCDWRFLNKDPYYTTYLDWYGDYFAWGETELGTKPEYSWETYKFGKELTKYNNKDNLNTLLSEDDAAYQNSNLKFCIPTPEQFNELIKNTINKPVEKYRNVYYLDGWLFIGKNGNELFFPACKKCGEKDVNEYPTNGNYWTNTVINSKINNMQYGMTLNFNTNKLKPEIFCAQCARYKGLPIRPVINL